MSSPVQPPSILDMEKLRANGASTVDFDDIESVEIPRPTVPEPPDLRDSPEGLSLPPSDCFPTPPESLPMAGFDLDEGDERAAADHQVQFIAPNAEAVGLDFPAGIPKVDDGQLLALKAEPVARIGPVIGRDRAGGRHGRRVRHTRRWYGTRQTRWGSVKTQRPPCRKPVP
jgi:hypothetical protein